MTYTTALGARVVAQKTCFLCSKDYRPTCNRQEYCPACKRQRKRYTQAEWARRNRAKRKENMQ